MKLVLDTNVLVAAFAARGVCAEVFEHCVLHHTIVTSQPLLEEFRSVLARKFRFTGADVRAAEALLRSRAEIVTPSPLKHPTCRDADDDIVLATAVAATGSCTLTGDKDLLESNAYSGVQIRRPADFWRFEYQGA